MGVSAVFIDGGYLDKIMYFDHHNQRIDYEKLVKEMVAPDELMRAYYYHVCRIRGIRPLTRSEVAMLHGIVL